MRKFLGYDNTTGLLTTTVTEDGKNHVIYEQDVQTHLDYSAALRQETNRCQEGRKEGLWHVAFVPDSVILKMRFEDGVNFYDKNQRKQVLKLLESKYPKTKTTHKRIA